MIYPPKLSIKQFLYIKKNEIALLIQYDHHSSLILSFSPSQIQTLTEDNISPDHFHRLVNLFLKLRISHQPAHTFHITQQHIKPHDSLDNDSFWCLRVIDCISKVKPNGPLVDCVTKVEVHSVEDQLLLTTGVDVGFRGQLLVGDLCDDF